MRAYQVQKKKKKEMKFITYMLTVPRIFSPTILEKDKIWKKEKKVLVMGIEQLNW